MNHQPTQQNMNANQNQPNPDAEQAEITLGPDHDANFNSAHEPRDQAEVSSSLLDETDLKASDYEPLDDAGGWEQYSGEDERGFDNEDVEDPSSDLSPQPYCEAQEEGAPPASAAEDVRRNAGMVQETSIERIIIDEKFKNRCTRLRDDEMSILRESIQREGPLSPLIVLRDSRGVVLVDGHHRLEILRDLGYKNIQTIEMAFPDREGAMEFIMELQLGRRNLSEDVWTLLLGDLYNSRKGRHGGSRDPRGQTGPLGNTAKKLAMEAGVSERTVKRAGQYAASVKVLGVAENIRAGTETRSREEIIKAARPVSKSEAGSMETLTYDQSPLRAMTLEAVHAIKKIEWANADFSWACRAREEILAAIPNDLINGLPAAEGGKSRPPSHHRMS